MAKTSTWLSGMSSLLFRVLLRAGVGGGVGVHALCSLTSCKLSLGFLTRQLCLFFFFTQRQATRSVVQLGVDGDVQELNAAVRDASPPLLLLRRTFVCLLIEAAREELKEFWHGEGPLINMSSGGTFNSSMDHELRLIPHV